MRERERAHLLLHHLHVRLAVLEDGRLDVEALGLRPLLASRRDLGSLRDARLDVLEDLVALSGRDLKQKLSGQYLSLGYEESNVPKVRKKSHRPRAKEERVSKAVEHELRGEDVRLR